MAQAACAALAGLQLETSGDSLFTARWRGRRLHSERGPRIEAERQLDATLGQAQSLVSVHFGGGLAYTIAGALQRGVERALWLEPNGEILFAALALNDFKAAIDQGRLKILLEMPAESIWLDLLRGIPSSAIRYIVHRASAQVDPRYIVALQQLESILRRRDVNRATLARFDRLWTSNLSRNLPELVAARPIARLYRKFPGIQCIVVGAGPSLGADLAALAPFAEIRERALIIAADTALAPMRAAGWTADFALCVDPQPINRRYLQRELDGAHVVVDPSCATAALRQLEVDRLWFIETPFELARRFVRFCNEDIGELSFGGSVSTNAYDLALRLGAKRVILVGQDLGFNDGLAHARGSALEEQLRFIERRLYRRELHNFRQLYALPPIMLRTNHGAALHSNEKLHIFWQWFARRIPADVAAGIEVLNLTANGAALPGARRGTRTDLLSSPVIDRTLLQTAGAAVDVELSGWRGSMHRAAFELNRVGKWAAEAASLCKRLSENPAAADEAALTKIEASIQGAADALSLVSGAMQGAIFRSEAQASSSVDAWRRSGEFFHALQSAAEYTSRRLQKLERLLDQGVAQRSG